MGGWEEKRQATRVPYVCEVECFGVGNTAISPRISDLSTSGAFIDSLTELPVGSTLMLKFSLNSTPLKVRAQVVHSMPSIGMGVRFLDLVPDQLALIAGVVCQLT